MNNGVDFPRELLTEIYQSIRYKTATNDNNYSVHLTEQ